MNLKETIKKYLQKIPAFISGVVVGVLITGAFFLFKINEYIIQLKETLYPRITIIEKEGTADNPSNNVKKYKKIKRQNNENKDIHDTDITKTVEERKEEVPIIEEKIISEKDIKIIHLNDHYSDTLLTQLAEVPEHTKNNTIKIIFKKNPFNTKGYLFEANNLVLYGLEDIAYINLYEYQGDLYMKYDKKVFKLPYTSYFQQLIKVEDQELLAKMN